MYSSSSFFLRRVWVTRSKGSRRAIIIGTCPLGTLVTSVLRWCWWNRCCWFFTPSSFAHIIDRRRNARGAGGLTSLLRLKRSILGWPVEGVAESLRRHGDLLLQRHENKSCVSAWVHGQTSNIRLPNRQMDRAWEFKSCLEIFSVILFFFSWISITEVHVRFVVAAS